MGLTKLASFIPHLHLLSSIISDYQNNKLIFIASCGTYQTGQLYSSFTFVVFNHLRLSKQQVNFHCKFWDLKWKMLSVLKDCNSCQLYSTHFVYVSQDKKILCVLIICTNCSIIQLNTCMAGKSFLKFMLQVYENA